MTTLRQIKDFVTPLLKRHDDLALIRHMVVLKPVRHVLRGIFVDRTGDAARCKPRWFVMRLFVKSEDVGLGHGELLYHPEGLWWWTDPNLPDTLVEIVERDALPTLHTVATLRDYVELTALPDHPRARALYGASHVLNLFAVGDLDAACDFLAAHEQAEAYWAPRLKQLGLDRRLPALRDRLGIADRAKLAGLLHEWEAYTVDKLKLQDVWEPTPFPLELASNAGD